MRDTIVRHPRIAAATVAYTAAFAGASPALGPRRVWPYLLVVWVVAAVVARVDRRVHLPTWVLAGFSLLGLLHCCGGLLSSPDPSVPVLYETWLLPGVAKYDQAVHAYGTGLACVAAWWTSRGRPPRARAMRAVAVATGVGILNELIEYALDLRFPTHVGGYDNALWDVVFNTSGALLALVVLVGWRDGGRSRSGAGPVTTHQ